MCAIIGLRQGSLRSNVWQLNGVPEVVEPVHGAMQTDKQLDAHHPLTAEGARASFRTITDNYNVFHGRTGPSDTCVHTVCW